jgi:hypothetical protein
MKRFFLFVLAFSLFSFMGARDYVKPVSSHEAVFVGSTNFPKDLQRYNQKPKFHKERQRIRILQASFIVWTSLKLELTLCIISLQAQT